MTSPQVQLDEAVHSSFGADDSYDGWLLTGYVLVTAHTRYDGDKRTTRLSRTYLGGSMPHHEIVGLLEYAKALTLHEE
jgi:hypothetical protein